MRWAPIIRPVERGMGGRPYPYSASTFLEDYQSALAYLSRFGYDGIVIWGFLRDSHGGIQAARELCRQADNYGMRIIAGVGVNCYGGIYWEGENEYNLQNWVQRHPELAAIDQDGKPIIKQSSDGGGSMLCPSRPENLQWHLDGLSYLLEEIPIHGILYETGDYGICSCPDCKNRSGHVQPYSYADLVDILPTLMTHVYSLRKDVMQIGLSYGTIPYYLSLGLGAVEKYLPKYAWYVWGFEGGAGWQAYEQDPWRSVIREPNDEVRPVTGRDIAFLSYNCYAGFDDGLISIERIRTAYRMCREKGIRGLMMMGELAEPSNLINYLSLDFFYRNPEADIWDCLDFVLAQKNKGRNRKN